MKNGRIKYIQYSELLTDSSVNLIKIKFLNDHRYQSNENNNTDIFNQDQEQDSELNYDNRKNNMNKELLEKFKNEYYENTLDFLNTYLNVSKYCTSKESKFDHIKDIEEKINYFSNSSFPLCLKPRDNIDYKKTIIVRTRV